MTFVGIRTGALIASFSRAWDARDLDGVMRMMALDCEFRSSTGPGPGTIYVGRAAVERAFEALLSQEPSPYVTAGPLHVLVADDFAVSRWTTETRSPAEPAVTTAACDIFVFAGPVIRVKDTYRKVLGPSPC